MNKRKHTIQSDRPTLWEETARSRRCINENETHDPSRLKPTRDWADVVYALIGVATPRARWPQRNFQEFSRIFPEYFPEFSKIFPEYFPEFSRILPRIFQNISRILPRIFQKFPEYSGIFRNIQEYSRIFWNILEYSKNFWNIPEYSGKFLK